MNVSHSQNWVNRFLTALLIWIFSHSVHNIYRTRLTVRIMFALYIYNSLMQKMQTQSRLFNYFSALSISVKISSFSRQSSRTARYLNHLKKESYDSFSIPLL